MLLYLVCLLIPVFAYGIQFLENSNSPIYNKYLVDNTIIIVFIIVLVVNYILTTKFDNFKDIKQNKDVYEKYPLIAKIFGFKEDGSIDLLSKTSRKYQLIFFAFVTFIIIPVIDYINEKYQISSFIANQVSGFINISSDNFFKAFILAFIIATPLLLIKNYMTNKERKNINDSNT